MLMDLLFVLAVRFFLFDFILFKNIRKNIGNSHYIFRKLFSCTFCQGFWCGLVFSCLYYQGRGIWTCLMFSFVSALISLTWSVAMYPLIKQYEKDQHLPMT